MRKPTKAIIAVAGYGTRRLPVAKAVEKCMLPLLNRPIIDYGVQDLIKAGVTDIYFVVSGDARQLRDYYSRDMELEAYLKKKGKEDVIAQIRPPKEVTFHYVEQDRNDPRYGTTVPAWLCRDYIDEDEQFYLIMGDQTLWRADGRSETLLLRDAVYEMGLDAGLIGVTVPHELVSQYGIIAKDAAGKYSYIVEHPKPEEAPSDLNNASIYVLPGTIMRLVEKQMREHKAGEYYIIDVLNDYAKQGNGVAVRDTDAAWLDCGYVEGWVAANKYLLDHQAIS